jgi:hypothetical protein
MHRRAFGIVVCAALVAGMGCGGESRPDRVPVSGTVMIDGEPLEHGFVQVVPSNARAASGKIGPGGRFELHTFDPGDGCVPGKHQVAVIANESIDPQSQRWHAPKKYINPDESGLVIDITGPTTDLVIELSWDGGEPFVERFGAE